MDGNWIARVLFKDTYSHFFIILCDILFISLCVHQLCCVNWFLLKHIHLASSNASTLSEVAIRFIRPSVCLSANKTDILLVNVC